MTLDKKIAQMIHPNLRHIYFLQLPQVLWQSFHQTHTWKPTQNSLHSLAQSLNFSSSTVLTTGQRPQVNMHLRLTQLQNSHPTSLYINFSLFSCSFQQQALHLTQVLYQVVNTATSSRYAIYNCIHRNVPSQYQAPRPWHSFIHVMRRRYYIIPWWPARHCRCRGQATSIWIYLICTVMLSIWFSRSI